MITKVVKPFLAHAALYRTRVGLYHRSRGFTLIELMFVLVIVSVLLFVAVPNYDSVMIGSKVDKVRYAVASSLAFARIEAVTSGSDIQICSGSADGVCGTSGNTDWSGLGWKVYSSTDGVLRREQSTNEGISITFSCGNFMTFDATGDRSAPTDATCQFTFADPDDASYNKCLWINLVGRTSMTDSGSC